MDNIVIIGRDQDGIRKLKQNLFNPFHKKDLGKLKYFLRIEIAQSTVWLCLRGSMSLIYFRKLVC